MHANQPSLETEEATSAVRSDLLYGLDDRPPLRETFFVALQHVFALFVGIITPPLIVCNALKLPAKDTAFLVSMSLFISGFATILQTRRFGPVGSGLLSIQGTSFTFIGPIITTAGFCLAQGFTVAQALGVVFGMCFCGSFVVMIVSRYIRHASKVITPVVTGTVVTLIGLTLIEVGITSMGGGFGAKADGTFGSVPNLLLSGFVLAVIIVLNMSKIPLVRMMSVVIGLAAGYVVALALGRVSFASLHDLPAFTVPVPFHYGFGFQWAALLPFVFMYMITVMESVGDLTATSSLTGQPISGPVYMRRLQGGLLADGINSLVASCFNSFPSTTFAQNNGVIQLTGVGSRYVGVFIGMILVVLGLVPFVGGLVQTLPPAVLGGATIVLFGTVACSGVRILAGVTFNRRNSLILAVSLGLGLGVTFVPGILEHLPALLKNTFASGIATGGICALFLNTVLPGERE